MVRPRKSHIRIFNQIYQGLPQEPDTLSIPTVLQDRAQQAQEPKTHSTGQCLQAHMASKWQGWDQTSSLNSPWAHVVPMPPSLKSTFHLLIPFSSWFSTVSLRPWKEALCTKISKRGLKKKKWQHTSNTIWVLSLVFVNLVFSSPTPRLPWKQTGFLSTISTFLICSTLPPFLLSVPSCQTLPPGRLYQLFTLSSSKGTA